MVPKFTLLAHVLLVSAILVAPSSGLQVGTGSREKSQLRSIKRSDQSNIRAGAVLSDLDLTTVAGTVTVPLIEGKDGTGASAWVGIDSDTCGSALSAGVAFTVSDGSFVWYQWRDVAYISIDVTVSAGDTILASVTVFNSTSAEVTMENLMKRTRDIVPIFSSDGDLPSCGQKAEWIVGTDTAGWWQDLANFGTVTITNAVAFHAHDGQEYNPGDGATILDIMGNNAPITSTSVSPDGLSVSVTYL